MSSDEASGGMPGSLGGTPGKLAGIGGTEVGAFLEALANFSNRIKFSDKN